MTAAPPKKRHTSLKGDILRLVSGTGLTQIIGALAVPILTRIYAPEAFGVASLFISLTSVLGVLACMRFELSIVLPDNDREAANLLAVSLLFSVLISTLTIPLIWYGGTQVLQWIGIPELAPYLWLVPFVVLMQGIFTALNYWNTRTKHFTRLSIARVSEAVTSNSSSLGAGFAGHATDGALIAAGIGGQILATTVLGGQILRDNGRFIFGSVTWREMWSGLKRHRNFPIYGSWAALLNTISWQLPVLMLGGFFSAAVAGFYALGFRLLQMPMNFLGSAISQVFHQRAAEAHNAQALAPLVDNLFKRLLQFACFPMLMLSVIGRDLYIVLLGEAWAEAGVYTQILVPWVLIWFISGPLNGLFGVLGRQKEGLKINLLIFLSRLVAMAVGAFFNSAILTIVLFSASGAVVYGYMIFLILRYADVPAKAVTPFIRSTVLKTAPHLGLALVATLCFDSIYVVLIAAALTMLYLWSNRSELRTLINRSAN